ncbi:hypothetical protein CCOS865_00877 [Pseudomonas reidholzensis]|uniref:Uncharacterized protein n=1 Tax=Pseudomonas reidholzensis TaxID=1785162 RepID=A0A383RNQ6_9PSED|nr:hypothetical protein CCOS865_00877 [Pseudomonas reidholzensis]
MLVLLALPSSRVNPLPQGPPQSTLWERVYPRRIHLGFSPDARPGHRAQGR